MPKNNQRNLQQDIAIAKICKDIEFIKGKITNIEDRIDDIENNHLKGIHQQLDSQKNWLIATLTTLILALAGIVLNLIR